MTINCILYLPSDSAEYPENLHNSWIALTVYTIKALKLSIFSHFKADILKIHHNCDTIILTHRKHALGYTVCAYGTEGLAQSFIGTNPSDRSPQGQAIVDLFERYMTGNMKFRVFCWFLYACKRPGMHEI